MQTREAGQRTRKKKKRSKRQVCPPDAEREGNRKEEECVWLAVTFAKDPEEPRNCAPAREKRAPDETKRPIPSALEPKGSFQDSVAGV